MLPTLSLALAALAPVACLAQGSESAGLLGVFNVQRLRQSCSRGGCYTDLYVTGKGDYMPGARSFDAHCNLYAVQGEWVECQSQVPYMPPDALLVKMSPWNQTAGAYEFWFSHQYTELERTVNATARMEVGKPEWDVSECRQMTVVSKEYI